MGLGGGKRQMRPQKKSRQMGRMLAELKRKYPKRLDLPSEAEIRGYVGSLLAKHRKG